MNQHQPVRWLHLGELIWSEIANHTLANSVSDLVNLAQTCHSFKDIAIRELYRKIYIVDDCVVAEPGMVLLYRYNLDRFIRSLQNNSKLSVYIKKIVILTDSSLSRSFVRNEYELLYEQLIRCKEQYGENVGAQYLKNLDANNLTQHEGLLEYSQMRFARKYLKSDSCECLYENDEDEFNGYPEQSQQIMERIPWRCYQIKDFSELECLTDSAREVYFYTHDKPTVPLSRFSSILSNVTRLELQTSSATESISSAGMMLFPALETLSITCAKVLSVSMGDIFEVINFQTLRNLEVKYDNKEHSEHFLAWWFEKLFKVLNSCSNLRKLSFVNLTTVNLLVNSLGSERWHGGRIPEFKSGWFDMADNLAWSKFLSKLDYFYCNLNNFDFIPIPVDDRAQIRLLHQGRDQRFLFNVDQSYYQSKRKWFTSLYDDANVKQLVIPDYFYTWKLFISFEPDGTLSNEKPTTIVDYLNQCQCSECHKRKNLFIETSKVTGPSFCGECSTSKTLSECKDLVESFDDTSNYRYFYHMVVKMLKERLPLNDRIMKNHSGLDIFEFPFAQSHAKSREHWRYRENKTETVKLMIHNLVPDLRYFKRQNPDLQDLVLGGLYFSFEGSEVRAMHYDCVLDIA